MPGTIYGQIDGRLATGADWKQCQELFVALNKFLASLVTAGIVELVASNYGSSAITSGYTTVFKNLHAAIPSSNAVPVTTGISAMTKAAVVQVVFPTPWGGGNVTLDGLDETGTPASEMLTGTDGATQVTTTLFSSITSISNSVVGDGSTSMLLQTKSVGAGLNYWDETDAAGQSAFCVYRWKKSGEAGTTTTRTHSWTFLVQWHRGGDQGGGAFPTIAPWGPYAPTVVQAAYSYVSIASAVGDDGLGADELTWAGDTNADGRDAKATPVWAATALAALPRQNGYGGAYATNKEEQAAIYRPADGDGSPVKYNFFADCDHLVLMLEYNDTDRWSPVIVGPYTPLDGLTIPHAHVMLVNNPTNAVRLRSDFWYGSDHGQWESGGIVTTFFAASPTSVLPYSPQYDTAQSATFQPTAQTSPPTYSAFPIGLYVNEGGAKGFIGELKTQLFRETAFTNTYQLNAALTRVSLGYSGTSSAIKPVLPWDGTTPVGSVLTRDGLQFP